MFIVPNRKIEIDIISNKTILRRHIRFENTHIANFDSI